MARIGYTSGVFDMFHIGHLNVLRRARAECDYLIVGVSTDELVMQLKGRRPIIPLDERLEIVRNIKYVDRAVAEDTTDKMAAWNNLNFDVTFKGDDWKGSEKWDALELQFRQVGVEVLYFPYTRQISSTILRSVLSSIYDNPMPER